VARLRIGELLVEAKVITSDQVEDALAAQATSKDDGLKLGQILVERGLITETQLTQTLSLQLSVPWVSLYHIDFSRQLLNMVPRELAERFSAVPIFVRNVKKQGNSLYVAMDDPTNEAALAEISRAAGLPVKPMIACLTDIRNAIRVYYADSTEVNAAQGAPPPPPPPPPLARDRIAAAPPPPAPLPPPPPPAPRASPANVARASPSGPPPAPRTGRAPLATIVDSAELVAHRLQHEAVPVSAQPASERVSHGSSADIARDSGWDERASSVPASDERASSVPASEDSPGAAPELEVGEYIPSSSRSSRRPRMVSLTLLDGTTLNLPEGRSSAVPPEGRISAPPSSQAPSTQRNTPASRAPSAVAEQLTRSRDRAPSAVAEQLTARDLVSALRAVAHGADASEVLGNNDWQAMFAALLSLLLKKNLIADWEFVEELRNI
jgi:type IV pilus assembly protein PilB